MYPKKDELSFYANAKLLLTGEYLVMHGAKAFAIPLRFGQSLAISSLDTSELLQWSAHDGDGAWFEMSLNTTTLSVLSSTDEQISGRLHAVLRGARILNPEFLMSGAG